MLAIFWAKQLRDSATWCRPWLPSASFIRFFRPFFSSAFSVRFFIRFCSTMWPTFSSATWYWYVTLTGRSKLGFKFCWRRKLFYFWSQKYRFYLYFWPFLVKNSINPVSLQSSIDVGMHIIAQNDHNTINWNASIRDFILSRVL